jgi:hypothetical protein
MGTHQGTTALTLDLEDDAVSNTLTVDDIEHNSDFRTYDGGWSEDSIQEILFDLFDGGDGSADADSDGIALGFTPIYDALTGGQKTTPGFTSVYSFLTHLKTTGGGAGVAGAIDALVAVQDIGAYDQFEQTGAGLRRYTVLPANASTVTVDVDGDALTTYATYGPIDSNYSGNKLYNWLFFKATMGVAGSYRLRVTPAAGGDVIIRSGGGLSPAEIDEFFTGDERLNFTTTSSGQTVTFAVGSFSNVAIPTGVTPFTIRLGTGVSVGKPNPLPVDDEAPHGNG